MVSSDWFVEFWTREVVHFSFIVIHNTSWLIGKFMFTEMLGPVIDKYINHKRQNVVIQSPIRGQEDKADMFTFDFRNTQDPIHNTESVSFMFIGELFYKWSSCHRFSTSDITRLRASKKAIWRSHLALPNA